MTVDVEFPDTLPCVSRIDGFGMRAAAGVIRTPYEAGNAQQRRAHRLLPQEIALTWRTSNEDLHPLIAWLNAHGFDWFRLSLAGIEASALDAIATPISVRLVSDLGVQLMQFHRINWWTVRATAEYWPELETAGPTPYVPPTPPIVIDLTQAGYTGKSGAGIIINLRDGA